MLKKKRVWRSVLPFVVVLICVPLLMYLVSGFLGGSADSQTLALAEESIRRAAVQCYALEGFYPTSIDYLIERYGVIAHENGFFVDYRFIASNLMPDITVLPQ